jgi:hypothetical protein
MRFQWNEGKPGSSLIVENVKSSEGFIVDQDPRESLQEAEKFNSPNEQRDIGEAAGIADRGMSESLNLERLDCARRIP